MKRPKPTYNAKVRVRQSLIHIEYVFALFEIFKDFCGTPPQKEWNKTFSTFSVWFSTLHCPVFNPYYELFYPNGVKVVPINIGELLTARGLAFWIMDDGCKAGSGLEFCTDSFLKEEVELLVEVLKTRFNLDCTYRVYQNGWRIYVKAHSIETLRALVLPYTYPYFHYKLFK